MCCHVCWIFVCKHQLPRETINSLTLNKEKYTILRLLFLSSGSKLSLQRLVKYFPANLSLTCFFFSPSSGCSFERGYKTFFLNFLHSMTTSCYAGSEVSWKSGGSCCYSLTTTHIHRQHISNKSSLLCWMCDYLPLSVVLAGENLMMPLHLRKKQKLQWFITLKDVMQHVTLLLARVWERDSHGFDVKKRCSDHNWKIKSDFQQQ